MDFVRAAALGNQESFYYLGLIYEEKKKNLIAHAAYQIALESNLSEKARFCLQRTASKVGSLDQDLIQLEIDKLKENIASLPFLKKETPKNAKTEIGKKHFTDGSLYIGQLLNGVPHGYGKKSARDGSLYQGEFINGLEDGFGISFSSNGTITHEGLWTQGKPRRK